MTALKAAQEYGDLVEAIAEGVLGGVEAFLHKLRCNTNPLHHDPTRSGNQLVARGLGCGEILVREVDAAIQSVDSLVLYWCSWCQSKCFCLLLHSVALALGGSQGTWSVSIASLDLDSCKSAVFSGMRQLRQMVHGAPQDSSRQLLCHAAQWPESRPPGFHLSRLRLEPLNHTT